MTFERAHVPAASPTTWPSPRLRCAVSPAVSTGVAQGDTPLDATTALVTGAEARVAELIPALEKEGLSAIGTPGDSLRLQEEIHRVGLRARSLDCYVQLPSTELDGHGAGSVADLRALVAKALLARFDALAVIAPLLAPGARLVIVTGDQVGTTRDTDFGLPDLSGLLALAVLAGDGAHSVRVTVVGEDSTAADIAALAREQAGGTASASPGVALAGYAALSPEISYVDWRLEVLSLAAALTDR